jgi:hypothetical protein
MTRMEKNEQLDTEISIVFPFLTKESLTGAAHAAGLAADNQGCNKWYQSMVSRHVLRSLIHGVLL